MVPTVLSRTCERSKLTAADKCGLVCWAHQDKAPNAALIFVFSNSVVRAFGSRRRSAEMQISLISSIYWLWDSSKPPSGVSAFDANSALNELVLLPSSQFCFHSAHSSRPQNKKSSTCPDISPTRSPFELTYLKQHGSVTQRVNRMDATYSDNLKNHSNGASTKP